MSYSFKVHYVGVIAFYKTLVLFIILFYSIQNVSFGHFQEVLI